MRQALAFRPGKNSADGAAVLGVGCSKRCLLLFDKKLITQKQAAQQLGLSERQIAFQAIHQTRPSLGGYFHQQVNMIISAVHADQGGSTKIVR